MTLLFQRCNEGRLRRRRIARVLRQFSKKGVIVYIVAARRPKPFDHCVLLWYRFRLPICNDIRVRLYDKITAYTMFIAINRSTTRVRYQFERRDAAVTWISFWNANPRVWHFRILVYDVTVDNGISNEFYVHKYRSSAIVACVDFFVWKTAEPIKTIRILNTRKCFVVVIPPLLPPEITKL